MRFRKSSSVTFKEVIRTMVLTQLHCANLESVTFQVNIFVKAVLHQCNLTV